MARAKQPPRVRTKQDTSTKVEDEALVPTEDESIPETEIDALGEAEDAAPSAFENAAPVVTEGPVAAEAEVAVEAETSIEVEARSENEAPIAVTESVEARPETNAESLVSSELGKDQLQPLATPANPHAVSFNTVFAEATDYSKSSLKNNCIFVNDILGAKTFESAVRIQSDYAKTSYIDFVTYLTRILAIYSKLTHSAFERRSHSA
jgi:hypothetical protein